MARVPSPGGRWATALLLSVVILAACGSTPTPAEPAARSGAGTTPPGAARDLASDLPVSPPPVSGAQATQSPTPPGVAADQPPSASPLPPRKAGLIWWSAGAPEPLDRPAALALDRRGHLYVVDAGHARIAVFDRDGQFLHAWGSPGGDAGQFRFLGIDHCPGGYHPEACAPEAGGGVAVDEQDRVYVADFANHRVQTFDQAGRFLASWGQAGDGPGEFRLPGGIAVDSRGHIHVGDRGNGRIQVFDRDGMFLTQWGGTGTTAGAFTGPAALAVDGERRIYVADAWPDRVQVFDGQGRFLQEWRPVGGGAGGVRLDGWRSGLAVDRHGRAYVAGADQVIRQFDWTGQPPAGWAADWSGGMRLLRPTGLAVDEEGDLYVADQTSDRVAKLRLLAPVMR